MAYSIPDSLLVKQNNDISTLYETSNMRDYKGLPGSPANNGRPGTSNFYSNTNTGDTKYNEDFGWKTVETEIPTKAGSASGQRNNNPHPKETFMVWKFPHKISESDDVMKESLLKELCEDKIRSTYQVDYMGLKQGEKSTFRHPENFITHVKKHMPPHTLSSTVRVDYQTPETDLGNLQGNTTRYGCNAKKVIPAIGVVPTVIHRSPLMKPTYDTSYTDEFTNQEEDNIKVSVSQYPDLTQFIKNMSVKEKGVVNKMFSYVKKGVEDQPEVIQQRISGWDGPSWK